MKMPNLRPKVLHLDRLRPYPQILHQAGEDCQGQKLQLITKIRKLWPQIFYSTGPSFHSNTEVKQNWAWIILGCETLQGISGSVLHAGNTKGGSITVPLTSCLNGLDQSVLQIKTKIVSCHTAYSKPVKQQVNTKGGSITIPLTSCLTGLDQSVLQIKTIIVICLTAYSKPVKQEVNGIRILPPLVLLAAPVVEYRMYWLSFIRVAPIPPPPPKKKTQLC